MYSVPRAPQVSVKRVLSALKANCLDPVLVPPTVRLLAARHQITPELAIDEDTFSALQDSSLSALSLAASGTNLLALGSALDYCALVRYR